MKKKPALLLALTFLAMAVVIAFNSRPNVQAQSASDAQRSAIVKVGPKLPSKCNPTGASGPAMFDLTVTDGVNEPGLYRCTAADTWRLAHRRFKIYTALLTQTGTSAPTAVVLENTLGAAVVWARSSAGTYTGTLASAFTVNKTSVDPQSVVAGVSGLYGLVKAVRTSANVVTVTTSDVDLVGDTAAATDAMLSSTMIEIRVYY
jgi:hypothetical protein